MSEAAREGSTSLADAAVEHALAGHRVFPLWGIADDGACACGDRQCPSPGKHPLHLVAPRGLTDASDDPDQVARWWGDHPDANIGLATGGHFFVVDLDGHDPAARFYSMAADSGWDVSDVPVATTGRGAHLFFAKDPEVHVRNQQGLLLEDGTRMEGVDVRGDGGYVVAPPSRHHSGKRYDWHRDLDALQVAPPGMLQLVARAAPAAAPTGAPRVHERDVDPAVVEQVRSALGAIPADQPRQEWLERVSMPVHDLFGGSEEGFQLWHDWCASAAGKVTPSGNPAYRGEDECRRVWRSFQAMHRNPKGIATLFQHARDHGWRPPAPANGHPAAAPATPWPDPPESVGNAVATTRLDLDALLYRLPTFRSYLQGVADLQQVPVEFPALMALAMAAGAAGNVHDVGLDGTSWVEPMALWVMCAMESGAGKSPVLKQLSAPFREWERAWLAGHDRDLTAWKAKVEAATARLDAARRQMRSSKTQGDPDLAGQVERRVGEALRDLAVLEAARPQSRTVLASNLTTPALVEYMQHHQGRCLIVDAEGGTFQHALGGRGPMDRDLDPWLKAFSADPIKQHRIGTGGRDGGVERYVDSPCLSIAVATQVGAMDALKDEWAAAKGLLPRFIHAAFPYALPEVAVVDGHVPERESAWWRDRVHALLDAQVPNEPRRVYLTGDAGAAFRAGVQAWLDRARGDVAADRDAVAGYGTPVGSKLRSIAMRVVGILHVLEDPVDPHHRVPDPGLVQAVIDHFLPFVARSVATSSAEMRDDPDRRVAERLLRYVHRQVDGRPRHEFSFSRGEAARAMRAKNDGPGQVRKVDDLNRALAMLVDAGWLAPVGDPQPRGAGTVAAATRYDVHPRFAEHYAALGDA